MAGVMNAMQGSAMLPIDVPYILVVESEPDIALLLQEAIKSELHLSTLFAATIKDAIKVTSVLKPILFLINEHLSDGDGIVLYDQLHQRAGFESIRALILSTQLDLCQSRTMERDVACLEIPFDLDDLLVALLSLLPLPQQSPERQKVS